MPAEKGEIVPLPYAPSAAPAATRASSRRLSPLRAAVCCVLGFVAVGSVLRNGSHCHHAVSRIMSKSSSIEGRVTKILTETPLIDGHDDLPIFIRALYGNHIYGDEFKELFEEGGMPGHVDIPKLRSGLNGGAFWSVFVPCPQNGSDFSDENYVESVKMTFEQIDLITRLKDAYPDVFSPMLDSSDAMAAFKKGQLISPLGVEGLHQIGNSAANLRLFHSLGVRYATLTHNCPNIYVDAALVESPLRVAPSLWGGVTPAGQKLINEMNRIGMIVDLSHTSPETMRDVLGAGSKGWAGSKAPVMFSHSSAHALCPHPRNVPDDVLQLVRATNSIVMINFSPNFVSCVDSGNESGVPDFYPPNSTLAHVVKHITYIGDLVGYDHVGLGSDFDGIQSVPDGLDGVDKFPDLFAELLRQGVSDEDAAKIAGRNLLRVWRDVDAVAAKMQADGEPPLEDDL